MFGIYKTNNIYYVCIRKQILNIINYDNARFSNIRGGVKSL